ncbi:hypothetical protein TRICI_002538 [Trichomonascus ciferrii]|uniref:DNA endonuclease activator Ctp1 C-terminal domain-containing protein n=1 Tax=Trichomonascus ciferrii TaxID=44093 RepID=A0A642V6H1_9ASCO|nr:hypothetical protein TRICI_002538 [Trichomonascus ciferrii]
MTKKYSAMERKLHELETKYKEVSHKLVERNKELKKCEGMRRNLDDRVKQFEAEKVELQKDLNAKAKEQRDGLRRGYDLELTRLNRLLEEQRDINAQKDSIISELRMELDAEKRENQDKGEGSPLKEWNSSQINSQFSTPRRRKPAQRNLSKSSTVYETTPSEPVFDDNYDDGASTQSTEASPVKEKRDEDEGVRVKVESDSQKDSYPLYDAETYYFEDEPGAGNDDADMSPVPKKRRMEDYATPKESARKTAPKSSIQHEADDTAHPRKFIASKAKMNQLATPVTDDKKRKKATTLDGFWHLSNTPSNPPKQQHQDKPEEAPTIEDLRSREWYPEDFLVNPKYNDGYDYAYHEVVRGKEQRQCKHGYDCSRCAKFYSIAGDGHKEAGVNWDSPKKADNEGVLSVVKYTSRHKEAEHDTPVGYWKSHMPNTQEEEEEKRISAQKAKEKGALRLESALHKDGKYLFKDKTLQSFVQNGHYL